MSAIMMSIKPEAVRDIASGRIKAEVKRSYPHFLKPPFKVYIYEARGEYKNQDKIGYTVYRHDGRGAVVGEAICHDIKEFTDSNGYEQANAIGMAPRDITKCLDGHTGYVFYFSDVKMYGIPKPIEAFGGKQPPGNWYHVKERSEQ